MPTHPESLKQLSSGNFFDTKAQMHAIQQAQQTQRTGHGDSKHALSTSELYERAEQLGFGDIMTEAHDLYLAACEGRKAVISDLLVRGSIGGVHNWETMLTYFGGSVQDGPRGHLGSKVMSLVLQLTKLFPNTASRNNSQLDTPSDAPSVVAASYPRGRDWRYLTIGETEREGKQGLVLNALEDSKALEIILLLNRIFGTKCWQDLDAVKLESYEFEMSDVDEELACGMPIARITRKAKDLLAVLRPALTVNIYDRRVMGGITDMSVQVNGIDQRQDLQAEYTAKIQIKKSSSAYRAANILAFGDDLKATDETELEVPVDPSRERKLECTLSQLRTVGGSLLKHTVDRRGDELVYGYTRNGKDVTESLSRGYLRSPLDALHFGLEQASRDAALNGCRHMAVSDGFTFIGAHLRELTEVHDDLIEANFNSHHALDMTEDGSAVKVLQYFINAAFRSVRVRRYVQILLEAASEHFGGAEISDTKVAELQLLIQKEFQQYRFYRTRDTSLVRSAKLFTKNRVPVIRNALAKFVRNFGAIAENGKYKSSDFGIIAYYRFDELEGISAKYGPIPGRSRSVAKVRFYGSRDAIGGKPPIGSAGSFQEPCALKVYDADPASIKRMERELEAYFRISQLSKADQRRAAKLLAFGAIDLDDADPRLFILLEDVKGSRTKLSIERQMREYDRVRNILKSVGVRHNDLKERNIRWQLDNRKWIIKVIGFDQVTFDDDYGTGAVSPS